MFFDRFPLTITLKPRRDHAAQYLRWGIQVGEVVHNIGSALDNLVWELAQPLPLPPSPSASSKVRWQYQGRLNQLGFPYTKTRTRWPESCERYLHFVTDARVRDTIEQAQAFWDFEQKGMDPEAHPLQLVHELWNRDKHHTLNVGAAGLQLQVSPVRMPELFPDVQNLHTELIEVFPLRAIDTVTEMARLMVYFPREVEFPSGREYTMPALIQPSFTLGMLFGKDSPGEGLNTLDVLLAAHDRATRILNEFA
jgi:hypothetical protein